MAFQNTGQQAYKVIKEKDPVTGNFTGNIMPNLVNISPQAIVPDTATITYNYPTDAAPTGGINGDIWYNSASDNLYKKISGTWTLLIDRVTNDNYVFPVQNLGDCPV